MKYTLFQNDKAIATAPDIAEARTIARSIIRTTKINNNGRVIRPSQYVYILKLVQEFTK